MIFPVLTKKAQVVERLQVTTVCCLNNNPQPFMLFAHLTSKYLESRATRRKSFVIFLSTCDDRAKQEKISKQALCSSRA